MMEFIAPIVCFSIPLVASAVAVRRGIGWAVLVLALVFAAVICWAILAGQQAQGWDGIGYVIIAVFLAAPALLGTLVGGGVGWWRKRWAKPLAVPEAHD